MKCSDLIKFMEELAPPHLAEDWDNVGLMVGSREDTVKGVMVCLDVTPEVIEAAEAAGANLIISHHPFIFKGLKRINGEDLKGKMIMDLIKKGINVYSAHTNLDVTDGGINQYLSGLLGLSNIKNLKKYKAERLLKLVVFVPKDSLDIVREAMGKAGAGWIGNYSDCSFTTEGIGTFRPQEGTNPYIGTQGELEKVEECRIETVASEKIIQRVISAIKSVHPYEEVAYDLYPLELSGKEFGLGCVGELSGTMSAKAFAEVVKTKLNTKNVRVIGNFDKDIKKVAVFCGSFDREIMELAKAQADVLVTGDVKYHDAMDMLQMGMCVIDAGHFGTERIIVPRLVELLKQRFGKLEVVGNNVEADPFNYI